MRIAVIADIHGNLAALDAVLAEIARLGIGRTVNLGDSLSGPLDPAGTADRLMALDLPTISGNHDRWLWDRPVADAPLWEQWAAPHLTTDHIAWLKSLPDALVTDGVRLAHGTPASDTTDWLHVRAPWGEMRPARLDEVLPHAAGCDEAVIVSGHTHFPRIVRLPDGRLLMNPGAVGCPAYLDDRTDPPFVNETGAPDARFGVLERVGGDWRATLHTVRYDADAMIARARDAGAESWAQALATGWVHPGCPTGLDARA